MKQRLFLFVAVIALAGLVGIVVSVSSRTTYQGRSVAAWTEQTEAMEPAVREAAARAFQALGTQALPDLIRMLESEDAVWRRGLWALAPKLPTQARQVLLRKIGSPQAPRRQILAARCVALLRSRGEPAIPALMRVVHGANEQARSEASLALGCIGKAALPALISALDHRDLNVRINALCALNAIPPADRQDATPALIRNVIDPDVRVSSSAYQILVRQDSALVPSLTNALSSPDRTDREGAALALTQMGVRTEQSAATLEEMLRSQDVNTRRTTLRAIRPGPPSDPGGFVPYIQALKDPDSQVKLIAIQNLNQTGAQAAPAVSGLAGCLTDSSAQVREWAARALGSIGPASEPVVPKLTLLLADPEGRVREAAREALEKIKKPQGR